MTGFNSSEYEELETLEPLEDIEGSESPASTFTAEPLQAKLDIEGYPQLGSLLKTFENFTFPALILSPRLYILWENSSYHDLFVHRERVLPISLAQDFPHHFDTEELGKMYASLNNPEGNYSYRLRIEAIHHKRLTRIFNVNITPIFFNGEETPLYYQAFFDDVTREQKLLIHNTFLSLLEASKLKDNDTGKHIQRVGGYCRILAEYLYRHVPDTTITPEFIENIQFLAQMHDVGKIGTPDDILNKEGPLDDREWGIMREHTINGAYIMSTYPHPMAREIALFHHEHWDGNGYPYRLSEDMIPISARIVAVADVYDALRMKRSYKSAMPHQEAAKIMLKNSGTHFDPRLIEYFKNLEDDFTAIYSRLGDD